MFVPDKTFKTIILDSLKDGEKSISSLHRLLKEGGYDIHRLILTGYLRAMEDLNVLKAKEIPPSKVYSVPVKTDMNIYEAIGAYCIEQEMGRDDKISLAVYSLQKILRRPVFLEEVERTGLGQNVGDGVMKVSSDERMEVKKILNKRGIKTRYNDPAYKATGDLEAEFNDMLLFLIVNKYMANRLVIDTKQTTLGV